MIAKVVYKYVFVFQMFLGMFNIFATQNCDFYNTVTVADFKDKNYIDQILNLNFGIELALLTPISNELQSTDQYENDLNGLKNEIQAFVELFKKFQIPIEEVRIHQPAGYTYYWNEQNNLSGFDFLNEFFTYCKGLGFQHFVVHTPYGNSNNKVELELNDFWEKLKLLSLNSHVEVEEIISSNNELKHLTQLRFYNGILFESLLSHQTATMLLDVHECGSATQTVNRMNDLKSKGFEIHSIHIHKDKHKILPNDELLLILNSHFSGNFINEGFLRDESSYEEFAKTKSPNCIVPNIQRIQILQGYVNLQQ